MVKEEVKVKMFKCTCGKARMLSVIVPGRKMSKDLMKEQIELLETCEVVILSLEEARKTELCCTCKL